MAEMKVITPTQNGVSKDDGPAVAKTFNEYDAKAADLEMKMTDLQESLAKKKYKVKTTVDTFNWMMDTFYSTVTWEGYECYAIAETYKEYDKAFSKAKPTSTGKVNIPVLPEILEASFHFMKKYTGTGVKTAAIHRTLCEDFSVTMAELNVDRQGLYDLATEAEAAKHGISVAEYKKAAQQIHADNGPGPDLK
jgi:hypothetical protein